MTVRDWLKDYEFWPLVEKYAMEHYNTETLDSEDSSPAQALLGAFLFSATEEGSDFWWNIYENLQVLRILQRTPNGLFFMCETDTGSRKRLLPSEVDVYIYECGWQPVNEPNSMRDGWIHWVSPTDTGAAKFINSLITSE